MNLTLLTPWQQLLWIVCAVILIVPVVAAGATSVIRGYFRAKEAHISKIAGLVAKAIGESVKIYEAKLGDALNKIKKEKESENP